MPTPDQHQDLKRGGWTSSWQPDPDRARPSEMPPPKERSLKEAIEQGRQMAQEQARTGHVHQAQP